MMHATQDSGRAHADAYVDQLREKRPNVPAYVFGYAVALDAHEPTHEYGYGHMVRTESYSGDSPVIVVWRSDFGPIGSKRTDALHRDVFIVDDGRTVTVWYVSGWGPTDEPNALVLRPFPVNVDANGEPRIRPDNGRPVDFGTWMLGPRRAWHLKVRTS